MMPKLVRAAGRRVRNYVLPLVGYWHLVARLDELRARLGEIEVLPADLLGEIETLFAARLAATEKRLSEVVGSEVERLDGYLVHHMAMLLAELANAQADLRSLCDQLLALGARPRVYQAQELGSLVLVDGFDLLVPTGELGVLAFLLRNGLNAIEPGVRAVLQDRLRPGDVAVDGGANIGLHSLTMATAVGTTGRLVSFEPLPHLAEALTWTLRLNGLDQRATVQRVALSDTVGQATLHAAPHSPISSLFALPDSACADSIIVPTMTLDSYLPPGSRLDLVKLDIEGAEPSAWRGMRRVREENPTLDIVVEWSASHFARADEAPAEFFRAIRADGFSVFVIEDAPVRGGLSPLDDEQAAAALEAANCAADPAAGGSCISSLSFPGAAGCQAGRRSGRAGAPPTNAKSGTSATTAEPAPITASRPMRMPGRTALPTPTSVRVPTLTEPAIAQPGAICAASPISLSWSTIAPVLTIVSVPTRVSVPTTARIITTTPSPSRALGAITAVGWMILGITKPRARRLSLMRCLTPLSPSVTTAAATPSARSWGSIESSPNTGTPSTTRAVGAASRRPTTSKPPIARTASRITFPWLPAPIRTMRRTSLIKPPEYCRDELTLAVRKRWRAGNLKHRASPEDGWFGWVDFPNGTNDLVAAHWTYPRFRGEVRNWDRAN